MMAVSPEGGWWLSCFSCGEPAYAAVRLVGSMHGEPMRVERGVCFECLAALLTAALPAAMGASAVLTEVSVQLELGLTAIGDQVD